RSRYSPLFPSTTLFRSGQLLASGGQDRTVVLRDAHADPGTRSLLGHEGRVGSVCFSPLEQRLATAGGWGEIKIWDTKTGHSLLRSEEHTSELQSPDHLV